MEWRDLFETQHSHVNSAELGPVPISYQDLVLKDLDPAQVRCVPRPNLNSIAWLLWHMARSEDVAVNAVICDADQVLDAAWRRDLRVDRVDIGTGMTADEVAAMSAAVDVDALIAYRLAVARQTRVAMAEFDDERLAVPAMAASQVEHLRDMGVFGPHAGHIPGFWSTKPLIWFLWLPTGHCYAHLGEAVTVRSELEAADAL
ncbi:MAG: DinB family protein [Acidimicrobiales bacterium]